MLTYMQYIAETKPGEVQTTKPIFPNNWYKKGYLRYLRYYADC